MFRRLLDLDANPGAFMGAKFEHGGRASSGGMYPHAHVCCSPQSSPPPSSSTVLEVRQRSD